MKEYCLDFNRVMFIGKTIICRFGSFFNLQKCQKLEVDFLLSISSLAQVNLS